MGADRWSEGCSRVAVQPREEEAPLDKNVVHAHRVRPARHHAVRVGGCRGRMDLDRPTGIVEPQLEERGPREAGRQDRGLGPGVGALSVQRHWHADPRHAQQHLRCTLPLRRVALRPPPGPQKQPGTGHGGARKRREDRCSGGMAASLGCALRSQPAVSLCSAGRLGQRQLINRLMCILIVMSVAVCPEQPGRGLLLITNTTAASEGRGRRSACVSLGSSSAGVRAEFLLRHCSAAAR